MNDWINQSLIGWDLNVIYSFTSCFFCLFVSLLIKISSNEKNKSITLLLDAVFSNFLKISVWFYSCRSSVLNHQIIPHPPKFGDFKPPNNSPWGINNSDHQIIPHGELFGWGIIKWTTVRIVRYAWILHITMTTFSCPILFFFCPWSLLKIYQVNTEWPNYNRLNFCSISKAQK